MYGSQWKRSRTWSFTDFPHARAHSHTHTQRHTHAYPLVCLNTVISLSLYSHRTPKLLHSPPEITTIEDKKDKIVAELQNVTFSFVSLTGHPCEPAYVLSVSPAPVHCKTRTADTWGAITVSNTLLHRIYIYSYSQQSNKGAQCCYGKIDFPWCTISSKLRYPCVGNSLSFLGMNRHIYKSNRSAVGDIALFPQWSACALFFSC